MKNINKLFFAFLLLTVADTFAGATQDWASIYRGLSGGADGGTCIAADDSGNVYVAGVTDHAGSEYYILIKYNATGQALWVKTYGNANDGGDEASAIALDHSGNIYITGTLGYSYGTLKYNSAGTMQWERTFSLGTGTVSQPWTIAVDNSGNVYVSGHSTTIKYSSSGVTLWSKLFGLSNNSGMADKIVIDESDNVYITGLSVDAQGIQNYLTVKYNSTGNLQWSQTYKGPVNGHNWAHSLAVDHSGNVYVTGESDGIGTGLDYVTIKYDALGGTQLWVKRYTDAGNNTSQYATGLTLDSVGNIYVSGNSLNGSMQDIVTIKYTPSGSEQWINRYDGPGGGNDIVRNITNDSHGNVYVCGQSLSITGNMDYVTIKYNSIGTEWTTLYETGYADESVYGLAVNQQGNVYVTGYIDEGPRKGGRNIATVKYSQGGSMIKNTIGEDDNLESPLSFSLNQNYPNPFNPVTNISFSTLNPGLVKLKVYNELGREVSTLVNQNMDAGTHTVSFDGSVLSSGVYFYELESGGFTDIKKMILVK